LADKDEPEPTTPASGVPVKASDAAKADELSEAELDEIVGGIGGTNGVARSGSGGATPPPTAPPQPGG
jgi:hypothetical protein